MQEPIIKTGDKYNKLTAIKFIEMRGRSHQHWLFKCDCGNEKVLSADSVKRERTKSCGCLAKDILSGNKRNLKHGMEGTETYWSWGSMKQRCLNKNDKHYKWYGARGITICDEWLGKKGFENFYKDMGEKPKNKSLDRIDNNGNYCKSNCRYATQKEQMNNMRRNHFLTYKNKTQTIAQWSEELNIKYTTIWARINRGWSTEESLIF